MNDIPRLKPSCQTCRFGAQTDILTCRRHPPSWLGQVPVVEAAFWCGEYREKDEIPPPPRNRKDEISSKAKEEAVEELAAKAKAKFAAEVRKAVEADTRAWVEWFVRQHVRFEVDPDRMKIIGEVRIRTSADLMPNAGAAYSRVCAERQIVKAIAEHLLQAVVSHIPQGEDGGMGEGEGAK